MGAFPQYRLDELLNQPFETFLNLADMAAFQKWGRSIPSRKLKVGTFLNKEEIDEKYKHDPVKGWIKK